MLEYYATIKNMIQTLSILKIYLKAGYLCTDMQTHKYAKTILMKKLSCRRAWSQTLLKRKKKKNCTGTHIENLRKDAKNEC